MGEGLVQALAKITSHPDFANEISVPTPNIDLTKIQDKLNTTDGDCQYSEVEYRAGPKGKGHASIFTREPKTKFNWSGFSQEVEEPTVEEAKGIFERFIKNPPRSPIPYYSGHLSNINFNSPLNPGPAILGNADLSDLHSEYHHIGSNGSANRMHWEDATWEEKTSTGRRYHGLSSFNQPYFGYKLWTIIKEHHIARFHDFIRREWKCSGCTGEVSHHSLLIAPSLLESEGIDFIILVSKPGKAVATKPGQYHQVLNYGPCAARSINYLRPGEEIQLERVIGCPEDGLVEQLQQHGARFIDLPTSSSPSPEPPRLKRSRKRHAPQEPTTRATRSYLAPRRKLDEQERLIREKDPLCRIPQIGQSDLSQPQLDVLMRVASIRSSFAVQQFIELVSAWRRRDVHVVISDAEDPLLQHGRCLKSVDEKTSLYEFKRRYAQACVARELDKKTASLGRLKRLYTDTEELARRLGMDVPKLDKHLAAGRAWNTICGSCDGLLPFILVNSNNPFHILKDEWKQLNSPQRKEEQEAFHGLLADDYIEHLCQAGRIFQDILIKGSKQVFEWEDGMFNLEAEDREILLHRTKEIAD
ncbi:hypothetical protein B0T10DRAFT_450932 [Thelonectria olida]|uniref:JmjC domain-containing protein n=1 Tax=Thelonectria olida TaxID=1576542 RepID=A0A9P8VP11_9HYPO|nr:hypothetical protein B0T10DRAFT_450932 [Thelonectria olida]